MNLTATCRNFDCVLFGHRREITIVQSDKNQPKGIIYYCESCGEALTVVYEVSGRKNYVRH
jgi:hypothetical protein